jgi:DNA-binding LytR/AlgR family response regulator
MNGNDFLKSIKHPPKVIFTTAYPEYALEGYELDVVDYLLKPVPFDRFLKAVNKAFPTGAAPDEKMDLAEKKKQAFVYFRIDRKMKKVILDDIMYIESMKDYYKTLYTWRHTDHQTIYQLCRRNASRKRVCKSASFLYCFIEQY